MLAESAVEKYKNVVGFCGDPQKLDLKA